MSCLSACPCLSILLKVAVLCNGVTCTVVYLFCIVICAEHVVDDVVSTATSQDELTGSQPLVPVDSVINAALDSDLSTSLPASQVMAL